MNFIYVLTGWEGSANNSRVLRDDVNKTQDFMSPEEITTYVMVDILMVMGSYHCIEVYDTISKSGAVVPHYHEIGKNTSI
ncbi:hypothetical protein ACS0TY_017890 [Phlomoides rotata]